MTPKDSYNLLLPKAHALYRAGDFQGAKEAYETAGSVLGEKIVQANIHLCNLRLNSNGKPTSGKSAKTDKSRESDNTETGQPEGRIRLTERPCWITRKVSETNEVRITANVVAPGNSGKACIILVKAFSEEWAQIPCERINLPKSTLHKCSFSYLPGDNVKNKEIAVVRSEKKFTTLKLGFALFESDPDAIALVDHIRVEASPPRLSVKTRAAEPAKPKAADELKVAIIADEFTTNSFEGEFISLPVEPSNWKDIFEESQPDLFFCESAWSGPDSKRRSWQGKIYASLNFKEENRGELLDALTYCRKKDIPTIFWNKEDPTHHHDRVHDFTKTASLFDHVFTTAEECVDSYRNTYGVRNVFSLPFATNPRLFNPVESEKRSEDIVFAGSWYANHAERCTDMEEILDHFLENGLGLRIYDRYHASSDPLHIWPEKYKGYLLPAKPHHEMPSIYKSSKYNLNINTVKDSSTMFARRVFELMSSNTLVISNYSKGVHEMFGDLVVFADREPKRLKSLDKAEIDSMRHTALHKVLRDHTYSNRWQRILNTIGQSFENRSITLTFSYIVKTRAEALSAISWYQQHGREFSKSELLLIADISMEPLDVSSFYQEFNRFGITVTSMLHATKYALSELYRPIETTHFVGLRSSISLEPMQISDGALHLQYMKGQFLALATPFDQRYKRMKAPFDAAILGNSNEFIDWIQMAASREAIEAYWV